MVVLVLIIPGLVEGMQILGLFILELAGSRIDYSRMFFLGLFILGGRFKLAQVPILLLVTEEREG
jgi:hypothetical protein